MSKIKFFQAHKAGAGDLLYTTDGTHIITCGADNLICLRKKDDLTKVVLELKGNEAPVTCLALNKTGKELVCGSEDNIVKSFRLPAGTFEKNVVRLTLPVRGMAFSPSGVYLAVASEESDIRLVNLFDTAQIIKLEGHSGPVRCLDFDPNATFLASSGDDGCVRIWRISDKMLMYTFRDLPIAGGAPYQFSKIAWSPSGGSLAVPAPHGRIEIKARDSWDTAFVLKGHRELVDIVSWSPNGSYLLSSCLGRVIMLWDVATHDSIGRFVCEEQIAQIRWSPSENAFAAIDVNGKIAVETNVVPSHMPMPFSAAGSIVVGAAPEKASVGAPQSNSSPGPKSAPTAQPKHSPAKSTTSTEATTTKAESVLTPAKSSAPTKFVIDDDDDDSDEEDRLARASAAKLRHKRLVRARESSSKKNKNDGQTFSISALKSTYGVESDDDELQEAEEALELEEYLREQQQREEQGYGYGTQRTGETKVVTKIVSAGVNPQPPFQAGCTPHDAGRRRYLAWNKIGTIISRQEDTFSSLEVEFADKATNRTIRLADRYGFTMAALAANGMVFASQSQKSEQKDGSSSKKGTDATTPSTIFFRPFSSWAQNSEWLAQMPLGEEVLAVAVGETFVAASTSQQYLRLFRSSGLQDLPIVLPGPVVSMAAEGSELAIVYHRTAPVGKTQHLATLVYRVDKKKQVVDAALPLRRKVTLQWIGYSDTGTLYAVDSGGLVLALQRGFGFQWGPVLDTATNPRLKSRGAVHWPIGVARGQLMCIVLKGDSPYPGTSPKPVPTAVTLTAPLLKLDTDVGVIEARHLQYELELAQMLRESENEVTPAITKKLQVMDTSILKAMNVACKTQKLVRALDLAMKLKLRRSYEVAVQLAMRANQESLGTRVNMAMRLKYGDAAVSTKAAAVEEVSESSSDEEEVDFSKADAQSEAEVAAKKKKKVRSANARSYSRKGQKYTSTKKQVTIFGASKPAHKSSPSKNKTPSTSTNKSAPVKTKAPPETCDTATPTPPKKALRTSKKTRSLSDSDSEEEVARETTNQKSEKGTPTEAKPTTASSEKQSPTTLTPAAAGLNITTKPPTSKPDMASTRANPFAQNKVNSGNKTAKPCVEASPTKRSGSVFDAIDGLQQPAAKPKPSPSPLKKRPALTRSASFAAEARKKQSTIFSKPGAGVSKAAAGAQQEKSAQARERRSKKMHDIRA